MIKGLIKVIYILLTLPIVLIGMLLCLLWKAYIRGYNMGVYMLESLDSPVRPTWRR